MKKIVNNELVLMGERLNVILKIVDVEGLDVLLLNVEGEGIDHTRVINGIKHLNKVIDAINILFNESVGHINNVSNFDEFKNFLRWVEEL